MRALKHRLPTRLSNDVIIPTGLADEVEGFLAGTLADSLRDHGRRVPVWAWLNEVTHADADTVRAVAGAPDVDRVDHELHTRQCLARAVVASLRDRDLADVQRDELLPLELRIAGTELTPRRLIELVGRALYL